GRRGEGLDHSLHAARHRRALPHDSALRRGRRGHDGRGGGDPQVHADLRGAGGAGGTGGGGRARGTVGGNRRRLRAPALTGELDRFNLHPMQTEPLLRWSEATTELIGFVSLFLVNGAI